MQKRLALAKWNDRRIAVEVWADAWGRTGARLLVDDVVVDQGTAGIFTGQLTGPLRYSLSAPPACEHTNHPSAKFCSQCGRLLESKKGVVILAEITFGLLESQVRIAIDGRWIASEKI